MQHEYTTVLACLVKTFPSKKDFRDLVQLTNYSDPESDFFEHMKHIQVSVKNTWTLIWINNCQILEPVFSPFRSIGEVVLWESWPNSCTRVVWWWCPAPSRITSCRTPWPPCSMKRCWRWPVNPRVCEDLCEMFIFILLMFVVCWQCFLLLRQHENVVSASVEMVGAVCRRLTWSKYLYYLKHFIHLLQTGQVEQKLAVRWGPFTFWKTLSSAHP